MKKMKKDEMARINLLVERAMSADPRLRRERERLVRERREKEEGKRKADEEKTLRERIEREVREREMAVKRAEEGECMQQFVSLVELYLRKYISTRSFSRVRIIYRIL
jgi:hypothetical protein